METLPRQNGQPGEQSEMDISRGRIERHAKTDRRKIQRRQKDTSKQGQSWGSLRHSAINLDKQRQIGGYKCIAIDADRQRFSQKKHVVRRTKRKQLIHHWKRIIHIKFAVAAVTHL